MYIKVALFTPIVIRFEALHGGISISFRFAVTPCVYLNYREAEVTASEKNLNSVVFRQSLSEIMVQGPEGRREGTKN